MAARVHFESELNKPSKQLERWEVVARQMLGVPTPTELPPAVHSQLARVDNLCQRAGGRLLSRQVIALVISRASITEPGKEAVINDHKPG